MFYQLVFIYLEILLYSLYLNGQKTPINNAGLKGPKYKKEVVDVTIALEDEKGNSTAGKEVVDVTMFQPIHQLDCNPVFYTLKCYFFHHY